MKQSNTASGFDQDFLSHAIDIIKNRLSYDFMSLNAKKASNTEAHGACPLCGGKDRFVVNIAGPRHGKSFCRQCGFSGDKLDLYMKINGIEKPIDAIRTIAPELLKDPSLTPAPKKQLPRQGSDNSKIEYIWDRCSTQLPGKILSLLHGRRKINKEIVKGMANAGRIRYRNHGGVDSVAVPFTTLQGKIEAIQFFTVDETPFPFTAKNKPAKRVFLKGSLPGNDCFFIAGPPIDQGGNILFIFEGIINALTISLYYHDMTCLALGGSTYTKKLKALKQYLNRFEKIVSCGDKDDAGQKLNQTIRAELGEKVHCLVWGPDDPPGCDVNDLQMTEQWDRIPQIIEAAEPVKLINGFPLKGKILESIMPLEDQIEAAEQKLKMSSDEDREKNFFNLCRLQFQYAENIFPRCGVPWETLPHNLTESLKQLARSCATNPMHLVGIVFAIVGASVGRHIEVKIKGSWDEPLIFWVISLLDSGDGKTPALNLLCHIIEEWQKEFDRSYQAEMKEFENAEKGSQIPEPKKPGGVYTTDYTIEALFRDQRYNGGAIIINDEATSFFDGQNQYKGGGKGTDGQQMLKLYDGKRARKIRVKDTLTLEGSRISIAGGTQPQVFESVFKEGDGDKFKVDGTLFRFMMTYDRGFYPSTTESWNDQNRGYWEQTINNAFFFCQAGTSMDENDELVVEATSLWFTDAALEFFIDWQNDYKAIKRFFPDALKGFLPKMYGWVARISGALKCLDEFQYGSRIDNPSIDTKLLKRAIKISEFYMGQNTEIMREMTLKSPGEKTFTDQEKQLCRTLQELKSDLDNGRLAVAYILEKYNQGAGPELKLKNSQALTALIRSAGLTIPKKKFRANGYINYTCLSWNKKLEALLEKYSTFSTNATSLQPQGCGDVENVHSNSTFSTKNHAHAENAEDVEEKSTPLKAALTGVVENVENVENSPQGNQENYQSADVVTI